MMQEQNDQETCMPEEARTEAEEAAAEAEKPAWNGISVFKRW